MTDEVDESQRPPELPAENSAVQPQFDSRELFKGHREVTIRHRDDVYRLSITRSGKLILRK
jgi:hemin uptake protein HemP